MKGLTRSLRWRTLAVIVVALVLSQATAFWLFDKYITQPRIAGTITQFVSHLKTISAAMQSLPPDRQLEFAGRIEQHDGIRIRAVRGDESMRPLDERPGLHIFVERLRQAFGPHVGVFAKSDDTSLPDGRARVLFVKLPAGDKDYWVAIPRARIEPSTTTALVAWAVIGIVIAILATFLLVSRLNRPLAELARAAMLIGRGGNPDPVRPSGPTEIRAVTNAFNQMQQDLRRNERERATFLAGVSHDLRTPLARMRLDVEMLEDRVDPAVHRGMLSDLADMGAIIDQFIDFTRAESSEQLSGVNLAELARACAERSMRSGVDVQCDLADLPLMLLRPLAMQRLVDNLLVNAGRHAGGSVLVRTAATPDGGAILSVLDRGPGIPADKVEHLKQPFTRLDEARSGSSGAGLGLAIATRVAGVHGGRLELLSREGGGLEARVTLPPANAAPEGVSS